MRRPAQRTIITCMKSWDSNNNTRVPAIAERYREFVLGAGRPRDPVVGEPGEDVVAEEKTKTKKPRRFKVLLHNDDYTTMEFVVHLLVTFFRKSHAEATHLMLTVHHKGSAVCGVYPREVAETKVDEVIRYARENGHPLLCTMEAE